MNKRFMMVICASIFIFLGALSIALAAPSEVPKSGQTTTYATGDDGNLQTGAEWPSPRFTVSGSLVTDELTGLIWPQNAGTPAVGSCGGGGKFWQAAMDYVDCLNMNSYLGYDDWRLPNINELKSLIHAGQPDVAAWLNAQGFTNVRGSSYWSSTLDTANEMYFWFVHLLRGGVNHESDANAFWTWPVRGGVAGAVSLPKTGQTVWIVWGDDGSLQKGVAAPDPRFTAVSADGGAVIADQLTGLVWTEDANAPGPVACGPGSAKTWQDALDYVGCLNSTSYLGYTDWRLPNRNEMAGLINYGESNAASWLNTQGFSNAQANYYWTSTSYADAPVGAWTVSLGGHSEDYDNKAGSYRVWPVRAGQSGLFHYLAVSKSGAGTGTVSVDRGALIWSGSTGTASYGSPMPVTITATPDSGSTFTGWSGDCSGTEPCILTMDADKNVTASFADEAATPPETSILDKPSNPSKGSVTFTFTSDDAAATFQCKKDKKAFAACTSPLTYWVSSGLHTFKVRAKNAAGNYDATPAIYTWTADSTKPDTTIEDKPSDPSKGSVTFAFTSNEAGVSFQCKKDSKAFAPCTSPTTYWVASGMHTFKVRAVDQAGNIDSTPATYTWTADAAKPDTSIVDKPSDPSTKIVTFTFNSNEGGVTFECKMDSWAYTACTSPKTYNWLKTGSHVFKVRAKDAVGNYDSTPAASTWTVAP